MAYFCSTVAVAVAAFLLLMYLWDRRAKQRGHQMRDPGAMGRLSRDGRRDMHVIDANPVVGSGVPSWTSFSRVNAGLEQGHRQNDELDDPHIGAQ